MIDRKMARARRWSYVLGSSIGAVAAASSSPASAQCSPDPTVPAGVTDCTGTDPDGLRVTTDGSTVLVAASATVAGSGRPAIAVDIPKQPGFYDARTAIIKVGGRVDGAAQSGIAVLSGSVPANDFDFYGTLASVTVEAGATVTGAAGITVGPSEGNPYSPARVSVANAGTISGTGGVALLATDPARGGFDAIENAQGGTIGAIVGTIGQLTNAGLIDGGTLSAIDQTTTYNSRVYPGEWSNSGTIRSSSAAATIANLSTSFNPLTNSGTIANTGTGAAIEGREGQRLTITNLAGGSITTAGTAAIVATAVNLVNAGTIQGDVVTSPPYYYFSNTIDSTQGTIEGNVTLGGGNDLVYGRYDGTETLVTGITGAIDAGTGTNSLVLAPSTGLTVSTAINLPTGFQHLRLAPETGVTLTLADGFIAPGTIELDGDGTVVNETAIATLGQAFVVPYPSSGSPHLVNAGSIDATVAQGYFYAIDFRFGGTLTNSGTITSNGNGVNLDDVFVNSGTIVAANTAVSLFGGSFDNSGTIRSTQGIGVEVRGSVGNTPAVNSGRIEGAGYGAVIGYALNNSGTIAATSTGTAVGLASYGVLNNLADGVISGGAYAITGHDPYGSTSVYNGTVFNAGTINGDVTFVSPLDNGYYSNNNTFVALAGGVLNGNLTLGTGDTLVTDLVNAGPSQFAGINGTVTTTGGLLRYRVSGEANAVIGAVGPFATTGYELVDGTRLTLTAAAPQTLPLVLAGSGTVDVTADIAVTNKTALTVTAAVSVPGITESGAQALTIVSRGTLSGTRNDYFGGGFGVVNLGGNNTVQNEGTIKAVYTATNGGDSFNAAAVFGDTLINNGRIELEGSYGSYGVESVVNTGTIVQTGSRTSYGITGASSVTNSGIIRTAGNAIQGSVQTITNSGTIASTASTAINDYYGSSRVTNLAGGTIIGGDGTAIRGGESVVNAGTIVGNVDFGYGYGGAYYANGGTLVGNLTFGSGNDLFLQSGDTTGVSGTIDAGAGRDVFGHALTSSATVAVGPAAGIGFEDAMVVALGTNTVATVTGIDAAFTDLHAAGDGTVVNEAQLSGRVVAGNAPYSGWSTIVGGTLGTFVNAGSIAGGVSGSAAHLANTGTIGSGDPYDPAVEVWAHGAFSLDNSGAIGITTAQNGVAAIAVSRNLTVPGTDAASATIVNGATGTITASGSGAVAIRSQGLSFVLDNAGRIEASGEDAIAIQVTGASVANVRNTGTILGAVVLGTGDDLVENSGTMGFVALGDGDDIFRLTGGSFASPIAGGAGRDTVEITGGEAWFATISDVEALRVSAGLATVAGSASFDSVALTGGRLIGLAGSTITAPTITVAQGATFGSAGTVNGNTAVAGTLSPGASPGVMTVNGNVSLAGGSTTLFEFVPAPGQSDQLLINGDLTIAAGAVLNLTGNRPLTPGVAYDMIVANSIAGQFTIGTWDHNEVQGFLRYLDGAAQDRLQLLGTFVSLDPLPAAAGTAVTYVNDLLVSGGTSSALLNSVNSLLDSNGYASAQAFNLLTPEVYASVMQLGIEKGLVQAKAGRSGVMEGAGERAALFTFGSGSGAWRTLNPVAATGASGAKNTVHEVLGGIGYGNAQASLSGFVGYLDGDQRIAALGARTNADGLVAGFSGHVALGELQLHALVSYDWSSADSSRTAPGVATVSSGYDLNSLVLDAVASYDAPLGHGLVITPAVGITHIVTDREATRESGSVAFALDVDGGSHAATFIDGAIALRGSPTSSIRPWAEIGVRYQLDGELPLASAGFVGATARFVVPGVSRERTVITYGVGVEASVAETISLFAGYRGESGDGSGSNLTGGVRVRF